MNQPSAVESSPSTCCRSSPRPGRFFFPACCQLATDYLALPIRRWCRSTFSLLSRPADTWQYHHLCHTWQYHHLCLPWLHRHCFIGVRPPCFGSHQPLIFAHRQRGELSRGTCMVPSPTDALLAYGPLSDDNQLWTVNMLARHGPQWGMS